MLRLLAPAPARIVRDELELALPDGRLIRVLRVRHPRARRIRLSVDERGARLTIPARASVRSADAFLHEHRDWLQQQLAAMAVDATGALQVGVSTHLPLRGSTVPLHWREGRMHRVLNAGDGLVFEVRNLHAHRNAAHADSAVKSALRDFYAAQARADLAAWLPGYRDGLPRSPSRIVIKPMTSQWGSLSPAGAMTLDLALILARPSAFEYVLVHELCHLLHANHSRAYWREVEARFPAWRDERAYFKSEGRRLKAALRALTVRG